MKPHGTWADMLTIPLSGTVMEYEKAIGNWERCGNAKQVVYFGLTKLDPKQIPAPDSYGEFVLCISCGGLGQNGHIEAVLNRHCGDVMYLKVGHLMLGGRLIEWEPFASTGGWDFEARFQNHRRGGLLWQVANIRELIARIKASPTAQKELAGACAAAIVAGKREFQYSGYYFDEALVRDVLHG